MLHFVVFLCCVFGLLSSLLALPFDTKAPEDRLLVLLARSGPNEAVRGACRPKFSQGAVNLPVVTQHGLLRGLVKDQELAAARISLASSQNLLIEGG